MASMAVSLTIITCDIFISPGHTAIFGYVLNRLLQRPIESMGRARLLDELSSKRDRRRVYGLAHLLDSLSSKWDRARSLDKQIKQ